MQACKGNLMQVAITFRDTEPMRDTILSTNKKNNRRGKSSKGVKERLECKSKNT